MNSAIPTGKILIDLARYRGRAYLWMSALLIFLPYLFGMVPGLVARTVFDSLSGNASVGFNVWSVLAVFVTATIFMESMVMVDFWLDCDGVCGNTFAPQCVSPGLTATRCTGNVN